MWKNLKDFDEFIKKGPYADFFIDLKNKKVEIKKIKY